MKFTPKKISKSLFQQPPGIQFLSLRVWRQTHVSKQFSFSPPQLREQHLLGVLDSPTRSQCANENEGALWLWRKARFYFPIRA